MAGKGKLKPSPRKDKSTSQEGLLPAVPVLGPFDEFKASPVRSSRRSPGTKLNPGLPDTKTSRQKKSPLPKDAEQKEGTIEVPGLNSLLAHMEKTVDGRQQSALAGLMPPKEHRELPSEEKVCTSNESSSNQTG